ncbi:MAG: glutaredoxin family protein [Kangiellaceae bacterium]|jgi:glutaredoxin|nr:glutaredoxin family protein [Kangiellaceae bacterium]|tara:strand:+ start:22232 stop:22723 length:492 start_codon:yes stop_codon:yes gene_type:complete
MKYLACILAFLSLLSLSIDAEIYQWRDANGQLHFSDNPPENEQTQVDKVEISESNRFPTVISQTHTEVNSSSEKSTASTSRNKKARVIMYSTSWCGYCKKARNYFRANRIPYKEYDIEKSKSARKAYDRIGGRGIPVILIGKDKKRMNGFSTQRFASLYQQAR